MNIGKVALVRTSGWAKLSFSLHPSGEPSLYSVTCGWEMVWLEHATASVPNMSQVGLPGYASRTR
ncbi:MAG: hypothetical protein ACE5NG_05800 [bacterium]